MVGFVRAILVRWWTNAFSPSPIARKIFSKTSSEFTLHRRSWKVCSFHLHLFPQAMVHGFNKPFVIVVLVPHFAVLQSWCDEQQIHCQYIHDSQHQSDSEISSRDRPTQWQTAQLQKKKIQKFVLSDSEWTTESGELTTSLKMIRTKLAEKYQSEIEKLYSWVLSLTNTTFRLSRAHWWNESRKQCILF